MKVDRRTDGGGESGHHDDSSSVTSPTSDTVQRVDAPVEQFDDIDESDPPDGVDGIFADAPPTMPTEARSITDQALMVIARLHPAAWLTLSATVVFVTIFGNLAVRRHDDFATWAFDLGIYDQGFWLVSRGKSFVTVRGLDFWGHHVNLIAVAFAPFYWLGAGPKFLLAVQAAALGAGAMPTYLLARDRIAGPWIGFVFALVYLLYAPIQWIAWANFHPEALVVTPFLFAWWFATQRRWTGCFVSLAIALSTREDVALAVIVFGFVLWWMLRQSRNATRPSADPDGVATRRDLRLALVVAALGMVWYAVSTRLVIPAFNRGQQPFYIGYFYGAYGDDTVEIARTILSRPDRVVSDATQPDRLRFYRDLLLPWGGLPLGGLFQLAMAGPQTLAAAIGGSPYARTIRYQYTAVIVAPIVIASIESVRMIWRYRVVRRYLVAWMLLCAYVTNVAWSPSPYGANADVWSQPEPRHEIMRDALTFVPDDASVTATYTLGPHLAHREQVYDWPNPFEPAYWGNDDTYRLPDPSEIDYLVIDRRQVGPGAQEMFAALIGAAGDYEVVFEADDVVVARRSSG